MTHNDLKQRACLSTFLRDKLAVLCEQILLNQINNALSLAQLFVYTVDDIRAIQRSIMEPHSYDKLYAPFKPYWAYWRELSEEAVYNGLLLNGWFADKLPPIFTAGKFVSYCNKRKMIGNNSRSDWIRFNYIRCNGQYREFGIPTPFTYERLAHGLASRWSDIVHHVQNHTLLQPYAVSRIHPRVIPGSKAIFQMNYSNWMNDPNPEPAILIGNKFVVKCDISTCFPSIYTHSLPWAIMGRGNAKLSRRSGNNSWADEIDALLQKVCDGETHGLLVGPHASNVVSELILTVIDARLFNKGYRFVRNIDDYSCYVASRYEAEQFIISLQEALSEFRLTLNQKKTEILELPIALSNSWVNSLRRNEPNEANPLGYKDVSSFLEYAVSLLPNYQNNASILLYAFKMLVSHSLKPSAKAYFRDYALHLAIVYPYLLATFEETIIEPLSIDKDYIECLSNIIISECLNHGDYLSVCYGLYYAIKFDFEVDMPDFEDIERANDCLLYLFIYLYAKHFRNNALLDRLGDLAAKFPEEGREFEEMWLFLYHIRSKDSLPPNEWRAIKNKGIKFIKPEYSN